MRKDLHNNIDAENALDSQTIGSNTTTVGNIIDTRGFGGLEFLIQSGTLTDGDYVPLIEEGDDPGLSDAAEIPAASYLNGKPDATFALADDDLVKRIGVKLGTKRYIRLSLVSTNVTTGGVFSAAAVKGNPDNAPVAV